MRSQYLTRVILLGVVLATILSACGGGKSIVVPNTPIPAGNLHIQMIINEPAAPTTLSSISIAFLDVTNDYVEFAQGEIIECNNVYLAFNSNSATYTGEVSIPPNGGSYTCVYQIPGENPTPFSVPRQETPRFRSATTIHIPRQGQTFTTQYVPGQDSASISGVARDSMGDQAIGSSEDDNGDYTWDGSDFSSFVKGDGTISLTREMTLTPPSNDFQSIYVVYDLTNTYQVTWM